MLCLIIIIIICGGCVIYDMNIGFKLVRQNDINQIYIYEERLFNSNRGSERIAGSFQVWPVHLFYYEEHLRRILWKSDDAFVIPLLMWDWSKRVTERNVWEWPQSYRLLSGPIGWLMDDSYVSAWSRPALLYGDALSCFLHSLYSHLYSLMSLKYSAKNR